MKICWITIYVNDMEQSLDFYTKIIGLKIIDTFSPKTGMNICFLNGGNIQLELIHDTTNNNISYGKDISIGFEVASIEEKIKDLKTKGIKNIIGPISPAPNIFFIFITDPNGLKLQLSEHKE